MKRRTIAGLIFIVTLLGVFLLLAIAQHKRNASEQVRPRRVAENSQPQATGNRVPANGDFQRALDQAKCGDTITLEAGARYSPKGESFILRKKERCLGTDADYITIQTSNLVGIPAAGKRVDPVKHAAAMPKLVGSDRSGEPVLKAEHGASRYRLVGIEVTTSGKPRTYTPDLISLGSYFDRQQRIDTQGFRFDRMFIHPAEISPANLFPSVVERTAGRGIAAGVADVRVTNSYIAGFAGKYPAGTASAGQRIDSYGVYCESGVGPIHVINNYIEAEFNNVFTGGTGQGTPNTATISNVTSNSATFSNVTSLQVGDLVALSSAACTATNPRSKPWQTGKVVSISGKNVSFTLLRAQNSCSPAPPLNGGTARWRGDNIRDVKILRNTLNKPDVWNSFSYPKAWIEIKGALGLEIDGNDMYSGVGTTVALTVRNEDGASPWCTIEDTKITNNRMRGFKWGFSLMMTDNEQPSMIGANLLLKNNLLYEAKPVEGAAANFLQLVSGHNIVIEHNTVIQSGSPVSSETQTTKLVFRDNIVNNGIYGMQCSLPPYAMQTCWPGLVFAKNIVVGEYPIYGKRTCADYPAGNWCASTIREVGFLDGSQHKYQLGDASKFRGRASDRTDPGCDIATLEAAMRAE